MELPKTRILIVEDNPDDEFLLMRQLRKAGLDQHVKVLTDGKAAIEFIENVETPCDDLIALFLDLKLPSVSGIHVLERVRANARTHKLPVIVMTSSNALEDLEKCRQLGVSNYVQKPVTFSTFTKAVADTFHTSPTPSDSAILPTNGID
jgi:two-component system response regulator